MLWSVHPPYESRTIHGKPQSLVDEKFPIMKEKANKTQNIALGETISATPNFIHVTFVEAFFAFILKNCPALDFHTPLHSTLPQKPQIKATSLVVRLGDDCQLHRCVL